MNNITCYKLHCIVYVIISSVGAIATCTNSVFACTDDYLIAFLPVLCSLSTSVLYMHSHTLSNYSTGQIVAAGYVPPFVCTYLHD